MHRIFVYGSLRRGESHHDLLQEAVFEREARTLPRYRLLHLGAYPGLVGGGQVAVLGEVYSITPAMRAKLDAYEDHPHLYERLPVTLQDGSRAETYFLVDGSAAAREVPSGDWKQRGTAVARPGDPTPVA